MKIYTSYYGKLKKIPEAIIPISISISKPKGINIPVLKKLAPSYDLLKWWKNSLQGEAEKEKYEKIYLRQISKINPDDIVNELKRISGGSDVVLLCYEKSGDFCHRNILAEWLTEHGYPAAEYMEEKWCF